MTRADTQQPRTPTFPMLTAASVAFLLEHQGYPGCTMASLTIRERFEVIEAKTKTDLLAQIETAVPDLIREIRLAPSFEDARHLLVDAIAAADR